MTRKSTRSTAPQSQAISNGVDLATRNLVNPTSNGTCIKRVREAGPDDEAAEHVQDDNEDTFPGLSFENRLQQYCYSPPPSKAPTRSIARPGQSQTRPRIFRSTRSKTSTPSSSIGSPKKRIKKVGRPPSYYAHHTPLTDRLAPDLYILFVGLNPGVRTSTAGHAYAHPSNLFWKLLYSSGITPRRCRPEEDELIPAELGLGNTNIVRRVTRDGGELTRQEMVEGWPLLEEKVKIWKPEVVCLVGKGVWEAVFEGIYGRRIKKDQFSWGWQEKRMAPIDEEWEGARIFVATSTSGLAASLSPAEKEAIWRPLGEWVQGRRTEDAEKGVVRAMHPPAGRKPEVKLEDEWATAAASSAGGGGEREGGGMLKLEGLLS